MLQTFFDQASLLLGIVQIKKGRVVHLTANPMALRFLDSKARSAVEIQLPPSLEAQWIPQIYSAFNERKSVRFQSRVPFGEDTEQRVLSLEMRCFDQEADIEKQKFAYMAEDISEREHLLSALEEERERFQLAIEGANAGLWDWNVTTDEVFFSPMWKSMLGYTEQEIPSNFLAWENLVHPDDRERALSTIRAYFENKIDRYRLEHRLRAKDGSYRWILAQGACIRGTDGRPLRMTGWHVDIHDLKSALEELKRQEEIIKRQQLKIVASAKMSSLGEMAGGIAHEINNPLAIIHLAAHQLRQCLVKPTTNELAALERIERTVERIVKIVKGLKSFSRSGEKDPMVEVKLEKVLLETLDLCRERFLSHGIRIESDLDSSLAVKGHSVQLSQVFLNLLNNSFDAISTQQSPWIRISCTRNDKTAVLRFIDSGHGIPNETAQKIFEPFFTTKEVGEGTGLGLSVSQGILAEHRGAISYEEEGGSTCFVVRLPLLHWPT
jgi:PAS domain S-box-containing protein